MIKLTNNIAVASLTIMALLSGAASAHAFNTVNAQESMPGRSNSSKVEFRTGKLYVKSGKNEIDEKRLDKAIIKVMGRDYDKFENVAQMTNTSPYFGNGHALTTWMVRGAALTKCAYVDCDLETYKVVVAIIDGEGPVQIYGLKDAHEKLPVLLDYEVKSSDKQQKQFNKEIPVALTGMRNSFGMAVMPTRPPLPPAKKTPAIKVNTQLLTGTYERPGKFEGGTLEVQEKPGGKIKFSLIARNGDHDGTADGVIKVVNRKAKYVSEYKWTLSFEFDKKGCGIDIDGDATAFGGLGVYPSGIYKKVKDTVSQEFLTETP